MHLPHPAIAGLGLPACLSWFLYSAMTGHKPDIILVCMSTDTHACNMCKLMLGVCSCPML